MCINNTPARINTFIACFCCQAFTRNEMYFTIYILLNVILKDNIIKFTFIKFEGEM